MSCLEPEGKRKKFSLYRKPFFICMTRTLLPMLLPRSIALALPVLLSVSSFAQIKDRNFTKQLGSQFKRYESGSMLFGGKINSRLSSKRIHVSEIPFRYSPFGGKRFPVNRMNIVDRRQIASPTMKSSIIHGTARVDANGKRALTDVSKVSSSTAVAQEFKNKYENSLDKRIDEWMNKVNNLSMADINRYQFRRGRSTTPGFPVQKAGGQDQPPSSTPLRSLSPQGMNALPQPKSKALSPYRMGPLRTTRTVSGVSSSSRPQPSVSRTPKAQLPSLNQGNRPRYTPSGTTKQHSFPAVRLGPRKIRVRTK